ncbi:hypothetical protein C0389_01865 [bacterium]|nr:hypothetical protein [bacterium]
MKRSTNSLLNKASLIFALSLIFTYAAAAQNTQAQKPVLNKYAVENILLGINSESEGVRKATINLAGQFELDQAVDLLIEQLKEEKIPELRILIAQSLYKIGNDKGLDAIYTNALSENDPNVKRMCNDLVKEYAAKKGIIVPSEN